MDEIFLATTTTGSPAPPRAQAHTLTASHTPSPLSTPAATPMAAPSRGRPKGWKPGMSYAEMRGNGTSAGIASRPVASLATARSARQVKQRNLPPGFTGWGRRGRPPKVPSPQPREVYRGLDMPFVAFLCEWAGCEAELHNLDTLRRHVFVVHEPSGPLFTCQWGKCRGKESKDEHDHHAAAASAAPEAFLDKESFRNHMEDAHFVPFSWHVGDGPRNRSDVAMAAAAATAISQGEIPDYLKDAQGNQVTPSIKDQELEDYLTYKINRQKLKELLIRMDENLPSEDSDVSVDDEYD